MNNIRPNDPAFPTMVVDNFFETPFLWRQWALSLDYYKGDRGTWSGLRSNFLDVLSPDLYETFLLTIQKHTKWYKKVNKIEATFQLIDQTYGKGWVHDDAPRHNVAGLVYLNDQYHANSGTSIFTQINQLEDRTLNDIFIEDVNTDSVETRNRLAPYRDQHRSYYKETINVEAQFNRCILFDPRCYHAANDYYGDTKETSRLSLVFFCCE